MRESRPYGSVRGARDETRVPTATKARFHRGARRRGGVALGGAGAAARRQSWRVGYLSPGTSVTNAAGVMMTEAFRLKLQDLGYIEGKNLKLDVRRAEQDYTRLPALAVEVVSLAPDVIVGSFDPATEALQRATSSIPIVMVSVADPIRSGFVKSLAKPGGNINWAVQSEPRHDR